jgi:hypothetical protein
MYAAAAERIGWKPVSLAIHDLDADKGGRIPVEQDERKRVEFSERLDDSGLPLQRKPRTDCPARSVRAPAAQPAIPPLLSAITRS